LERFDVAERCNRRAIALLESRSQGYEKTYYWAQLNLACVHQAREEFQEAEAGYRRALDIAERSLRAGDPEFPGIWNNLCYLLVLMGRYDEGRPLCERSIAESKRLRGAAHPNVANNIHSLAELELRAGNLDRAENLLQEALGIAPDPVQPMIQLSLAQTFERAGRVADAETAYRAVLSARVSDDLHGESKAAAVAMEALASFLRRAGRAEEAGRLETRARELRIRVGGGPGTTGFAPMAAAPEAKATSARP
jgi:tetratricopeptide (TPR) repeat protein